MKSFPTVFSLYRANYLSLFGERLKVMTITLLDFATLWLNSLPQRDRKKGHGDTGSRVLEKRSMRVFFFVSQVDAFPSGKRLALYSSTHALESSCFHIYTSHRSLFFLSGYLTFCPFFFSSPTDNTVKRIHFSSSHRLVGMFSIAINSTSDNVRVGILYNFLRIHDKIVKKSKFFFLLYH